MWLLTQKSEGFSAENHFYVFVLLRKVGVRPDFHIVPSQVVAKYISVNHRQWLAETKADGSPRKDSAIRNFCDPDLQYQEAWDLLNL